VKKLKVPAWVWIMLAVDANTALLKGLHVDLERVSWMAIASPLIGIVVGLGIAVWVVRGILRKAR
jgi:hypothetical protein